MFVSKFQPQFQTRGVSLHFNTIRQISITDDDGPTEPIYSLRSVKQLLQ